MADRCLAQIMRSGESIEYVEGFPCMEKMVYVNRSGKWLCIPIPDGAAFEPCPNPILGVGSNLAGCGCNCREHCGAPITDDWIGYGEDHGDDVRRHYEELPNGVVEASELASTLRSRHGD